MKTRILGKNLTVNAIGLGCMGLSQGYPPFPDKKESLAFLKEAVEKGQNFFDTSERYGIYENERLLGEALAPYRSRVILATKFGWNIQDGRVLGLDSTPKTIKKAVEGSLMRLKTDYIDLYYQHRVDPNVPIEVVAETMKELYQEGKILHWGLCEAKAETIRKAHQVFPLTAVQSEYSMWYREQENEIFPLLEELNIGFVAYSPLGRGFLTGKIGQDAVFSENDIRHSLPRFSEKEYLKKNQQLVLEIEKFAAKRGYTSAQVALAWLLSRKQWITAIPGTKKISRLQENMQAAEIELSAQELEELDAIINKTVIYGRRYNAARESMIGR